MDKTRELGLNLFTKFINSKSDKLYEEELFKYSDSNIQKYLSKAKYLFELINPKAKQFNKILVTKLKKNKITPNDLIHLQPWELCKEHWEQILEEQNKTDKIVMEKTAACTSTQFTCAKCKGKETSTYQCQTRSADEPMTIFVTCIKCNNTWRM